jgi:GR25 family glycosyltransferase involved in LPS biosynthesis
MLPHFFILNLKRYPKKYQRTLKNLKKAGITPDVTDILRFNAYDGVNELPNMKAIKEHKDEKDLYHQLDIMRSMLAKNGILKKNMGDWYVTPGEVGHYLSFYMMFKAAYTNKYKSIFIVEDDIYFVDPRNFLSDFHQFMKDVPKNWDIIYFGMNQSYYKSGGKLHKIKQTDVCIPTGTESPLNKYNSVIYGNYAILYSEKAIKYFVKHMMPMGMPTDIYMGRVCTSGKLNCYSTCKNWIQPIITEGSTTTKYKKYAK